MTFDQNMLGPAFLIFLVFTVTGCLVSVASGRKTARLQRAEYMRGGGIPAHGWVDNSASLGANIVCWLLCGIGTYIALTLFLFRGNVLWGMHLLDWLHGN